MKKIILYSIASLLALTCFPNEGSASAGPIKTELAGDPVVTKISLTNRLNEIQMMDKSKLNNFEKKALRKEIRSIDKTLKLGPGGVYISVGALILIIILLIIIF